MWTGVHPAARTGSGTGSNSIVTSTKADGELRFHCMRNRWGQALISVSAIGILEPIRDRHKGASA
jgi:hypothetical protein